LWQKATHYNNRGPTPGKTSCEIDHSVVALICLSNFVQEVKRLHIYG
jgi:hypothetical protein